jgi:hypothetical protein
LVGSVFIQLHAVAKELGFESIEDGVEAELKAVLGCRAVVGSGCFEACLQPWELRRVAVGVWANGEEAYACHGVTSVDNALPIDRDTL